MIKINVELRLECDFSTAHHYVTRYNVLALANILLNPAQPCTALRSSLLSCTNNQVFHTNASMLINFVIPYLQMRLIFYKFIFILVFAIMLLRIEVVPLYERHIQFVIKIIFKEARKHLEHVLYTHILGNIFKDKRKLVWINTECE